MAGLRKVPIALYLNFIARKGERCQAVVSGRLVAFRISGALLTADC